MKFRTRLFITLLVLALVTNSISMGVMYTLARQNQLDAFTSKVLSIASTTAAMLDGDLHKSIQTRADEGSDAYRAIQQKLRTARDANRRPDTYVKYLTTMIARPGDPNTLLFAVDPEENPRDASHVEDVFRSKRKRQLKLDTPGVDKTISEDQWGRWIEANAPVKDRNGNIVAAVLADVSSDELDASLRPLWISALASTALAISLAFGAALLFSAKMNRPLATLVQALERIGGGDLSTSVEVKGHDEFATLSRTVNSMVTGLRERETMKNAFARYVSRQVMDTVLDSGRLPTLSGDRRRITALFCDIRGFTRMSENMRPEEVVEILNEYFEKVVDIVIRNGGTLDKFLGDGVMVVFGAPQDDPYQEEHAVKTALEIREQVRLLSADHARRQLPPIAVGIGINSGNAIVGNIGASQRMEYTAIGDTVNLASRLESATRELGVDILISEYTYNAVRGAFRMNSAGSIHVKGRTDAVMTYTVLPGENPGVQDFTRVQQEILRSP